MGINIGNTEINSIYYGSTPVKEVYLGENKVRPVQKYKTYTVVWNEVSNPANFFVRYEDDAAGMTQGSTDWDTIFNYSAVKLSNNGTETAELNQTSPGVLPITQLGTITSGDNVMIKFPRMGVKMSKSGSQVTLSITDNPNADGFQYYAFTRGSNDKDYLYLGAYKMGSSYNSLSGLTPLASKTPSEIRSGITSKYGSGTSYSMITLYPRLYISCLYMMKYCNPDARNIVGYGATYSVLDTGGTNSQTNATYGTAATSKQIKLFGLEDFWGNLAEITDCCLWDSNKHLTADKTNSIFQDTAYSTDLGLPNTNYSSAISGNNDSMFLPTTGGGSRTTYYTFFVTPFENQTVLFGSHASGSTYGAHPLQAGSYAPNSKFRGNGSRLMYL